MTQGIRNAWKNPRNPCSLRFFPENPGCALTCLGGSSPHLQLKRGSTVNSTLSICDQNVSTTNRSAVTLSPWVNEPLPPFQELLSAHDVARLTRRPRLVISGLVLLRRFPKKRRFRGRQIGWLRAEVLEWLARDLAIDDGPEPPPRCRARRQPHQKCLPFECGSSCAPPNPCATRRRRA